MAKGFSEFERNKSRFQKLDKKSKTAQAAERAGIKNAPPSMSSLYKLHNKGVFNSYTKDSAAPVEDIKNIMSDKVEYTTHNIMKAVENANSYGNPAQYTKETLNYIKKSSNGVIFGMDTEWLGGGTLGNAMPVEIGIVKANIDVSEVGRAVGQKTAYAVQLKKEDADKIAGLIKRLRSEGHPNFTPDEYRTLKDLINYSGDTIGDGGKITRKAKFALADKANLRGYIKEIEEGFAALNPANKNSKALTRLKGLQETIGAVINGAYGVNHNPILSFHNGLNADLQAWEKSYGVSISDIFGLNKKAKMLDTLSWIRSSKNSMLLEYADIGVDLSPSSLSSLMKIVMPGMDTSMAHDAGFDSHMTALLSQYLYKNKDSYKFDIKMEGKYKQGTELFALNGLYRNNNSPLNYAMDVVRDAKGNIIDYKPRDYHSQAIYRNRLYKIQKEFTYEYSGKKYYGVVLHNTTDDLYHQIAAESQEQIQTMIQSNFMSMDEAVKRRVERKGSKVATANMSEQIYKEIHAYTKMSSARAEYQNMFRGKDAYKNFSKYMDMYDIVSRHGGSINAAQGRLIRKGYKKGQIEKFSYMFDRMQSEIKMLRDIQKRLDVLPNNDKKSIALKFFKEKVDSTIGAHVENIGLPADFYRQSRIFDPTRGIFVTVDARSKGRLTNDIRRIAIDAGGTSRHGFLEARERLREMVSYMEYGGQYGKSILSKEEASTLYGLIDGLKQNRKISIPRGIGGTGREEFTGINDIASAISEMVHGRLDVQSVIEDQESLARRTIKGWDQIPGIAKQSIDLADRFLNSKFGFNDIDGKVLEHLHKVDERIKGKIIKASSVVASDYERFGAMPIVEQLEKVGKRYANNGIAMDVIMSTQKGRGPGLEMAFYAAETAQGVVNYNREKAAKVFIPLVDEMGLFEVNGVKSVNRLRPTIRGTQERLETYQGKIFEAIRYSSGTQYNGKSFAEEVSRLIKHGKADDAQKMLQRMVRRSVHGLSSASMYGYDEYMKDLIGSSLTHYDTKRMQIDIKDMVYRLTGGDKGWDDLMHRDKTGFLRAILYPSSIVNDIGVATDLSRSVTKTLQRLGLNVSVDASKAESVSKGILNAEGFDPRRYGFLGYFNDPGGENLKAAQRYHLLRKTGSLGRFSKPLAMTEDYYKGTKEYYEKGLSTHLNVHTLFLSDEDIRMIAQDKNIDLNDWHFMERLTTHDDMMMMDAKAMRQFHAVEPTKIKVGEFDSVNGKFKRGDVIKPGQFLGARDNTIKYDSKYWGVIKDIRDNEVIVDQIMPGTGGMKMAGIDAGNKFTTRITTTQDIIDQLGLEGEWTKNIAAIANPKVSSRPGDMMASQLRLLVHELTVGKQQKQDILDSVHVAIYNMFAPDGQRIEQIQKKASESLAGAKNRQLVNYVQQNVKFSDDGVLLLPSSLHRGNITNILGKDHAGKSLIIHQQPFLDTVGDILRNNGAQSNAIEFMTPDGKKVKRYRGIMGLARVNVFDTAEVVGSDSIGLVKYGFRELDTLRSRKYFLDTDISRVISNIENKVYKNAKEYGHEGVQILDSLRHFSGYNIDGQDAIGTIRTRGIVGTLDKDIKDVANLVRTDSGSYLERQLRGTIFDQDLFDKRGFFLELPEAFKVGNRNVDKVFIPSFHSQISDGRVYLNDVQKKAKRIFDAVNDYRLNANMGDDVASEAIYRDARNKLPGLIDDYYTSMGNALSKSKGYLQNELFSARLDHSGRFKYQGLNPYDWSDKFGEIADTLGEGEALVSRQEFEAMLGNINPKSKSIIMERAQDKGYVGIATRYPSKDIDTSLPMKLRILSEEAESNLAKKGINLNGNLYVTLGSQIRHNADHDGDTISIVLASLGGKKAETLEKEMDTWWAEEVKINRDIAEEKLKNLDYAKDLEVQYKIGDKKIPGQLADRYGFDINDASLISKVEAKITKDNVGRFSNASVKIRRMAETVGSFAVKEGTDIKKAMEPFIGLTYALTAFEQAPISAKKIAGTLSEKGITSKSAQFKYFLEASEDLFDSIVNLDGSAAVDAGEKLGFFKKIDGRLVFSGAGKLEEERARAIRIKMGIGDETGRLYADDIVGYFSKVKQSFADPNIWDKGLGIGMKDADSAEGAARMASILATGDTQYAFPFLRDVYKTFGMDDMYKKAVQNAEFYHNKTSTGMRAFGSEAVQTIGDAAKGGFLDDAAKFMSSRAMGGVGIAAAGLFAVGSIINRPPSPKEVNRGIPDQAPSSDGQYASPTMFAGSPPGAGPTARLLPKGTGYDRVNITIDANSLNGMTNDDVASIISQEVERQTQMNLNINITSQDDRASIDRSWLQQQFSNALKSGYVT